MKQTMFLIQQININLTSAKFSANPHKTNHMKGASPTLPASQSFLLLRAATSSVQLAAYFFSAPLPRAASTPRSCLL
jgi:hypothetical protein